MGEKGEIVLFALRSIAVFTVEPPICSAMASAEAASAVAQNGRNFHNDLEDKAKLSQFVGGAHSSSANRERLRRE